MDTSSYNRMVIERIKTDSPEVFGNMTPENARFIVPALIDAAQESVVIFSGSMPPWFYDEAENGVEPILDVIRRAATRLYGKFGAGAAGSIRIITANGDFDPRLNVFAADVAARNGGVEVVKILQAAYSGDAGTLKHFIVVDHKRYRLESPHGRCRDSKLEKVLAEVCCNGPAKALRLESSFDSIWGKLEAKRGA